MLKRYNVQVFVNGFHRITVPCDHVEEAFKPAVEQLCLSENDRVTFVPTLNYRGLIVNHNGNMLS